MKREQASQAVEPPRERKEKKDTESRESRGHFGTHPAAGVHVDSVNTRARNALPYRVQLEAALLEISQIPWS